MYRRVVFIGLGGSGGKTLRFIKRDLRHWLTEHDWPESREIPDGFQFLHIDTPTVQDGVSMGGAEMLPDKEYLGLVGPGVNFQNVVNQLDNKIGIKEEFAAWRVAPPLNVPIATGAGAYRAVGRTIALAYMDQIKSGIRGLLNRASSPKSVSDLTELWKKVHGNNPSGQAADPIVVVVSSLAGGTGAGLLMDVFDVVRSLESWGDSSFGILYTPEVFASIGGGLMGGVQPNSLAAISEILNGCYWHGVQKGHDASSELTEIGLKQPKTLQVAGVVGAIARSGPAYPFLVGSKNAANVHFTSDKQVFETIGSALVAWCVDEVVQDNLIAFTMANWDTKSSINVSQNDLVINRGANSEQGMPAFNALGCARVSVGTRYLERYSAQRIARDALTYMAGYHMESDEARGYATRLNTNKPEEIAHAIAEDKLLWFLIKIGLNERGADANDVVDALRPREWEALEGAAIGVATQLSQLSGKQSAQEHLDAIIPAVQTATDDLDRAARPLIERNVKEWTETTPVKVISAIEEAIANYGFEVTIKLLELTISYLKHPTEGVCAELMGENEHKKYSQWAEATQWSAQAHAVLAGIRGKFTSSDSSISEAIVHAINSSKHIVEAQICEYANLLLLEFASGFLEPLKRVVADASVLLSKQIEDIVGWPTWTDGLPPADSTPPKSEFTLIDPASFGDVFVQTLAKTIGGDQLEKLLHRSTARTSVISGDFLREMEAFANLNKNLVRPAQAIQITQPWHPSSLVVRDSTRPKADVVVELKFAPNDLQQRARMWLRRPNTAFDDLLKSTLRTYTAGDAVFSANIHVDETEYQARRTKFIVQLKSAISASAPLVHLDESLQQFIHQRRELKRQFSSFPFNGHVLQDEVIAEIRNFIGDDSEASDADIKKRYMVNDASIESIQIMSMLNGAHHPFLFKSLLEPIGERWSQINATPAERSLFWSKRRARLLGEFIPAPQEHIVAFVRGWFTGRLLGLIDVPRNGQKGAIKISQPWSLEKGTASFPHPLLTTPTEQYAGDELFAVLESLSLAFVAVGQQNNLNPLRAYIVLRDMGSMLDGSERILQYDLANPLIRNWILTGEISVEFDGKKKDELTLRRDLGCKMHESLTAVSGSGHDPDSRKRALVDLLSQVLGNYSADGDTYWERATLNKATLNNPPFWPGIRNTSETPDIIVRALQSLIYGVERVSTKSTTGV